MPKKKKKTVKTSKTPPVTFVILVIVLIMVFTIIDITEGYNIISLIVNVISNLFEEEKYVVANVLEVAGNTIIIGNNCTVIVAETSAERAYSIDLGKRGVIEERPTTHDVFAEVLKSFNITLEHVQIDKFDGKYYYAYLYLMSGDKILRLDTKPSDAIALALRTDSNIYIKKSLLDEIGKDIC